MTGDQTHDEPQHPDSATLRVRSLVYTGVAWAYGSRYPLPARDDWDNSEEDDRGDR